MAPSSGHAFNSVVRNMDMNSRVDDSSKDVITPLQATSLKLPIPETVVGLSTQDAVILPEEREALSLVAKFFEEVHCLYWLYVPEQFHGRLESHYSSQKPSFTSSWLCSLYSVLALGAAAMTGSATSHSATESHKYLAMAKALGSRVFDEADIDSVRALLLMVGSHSTA